MPEFTRRSFVGASLASAAFAAAPKTAWSERLGVMCIFAATEKPAREVLAAARQAGFHRIQMTFPWTKVDAGFLKGLPSWVQAEGLRCEALGAYVNCVDPAAVLMNTRAEDFAHALEYAAELGSRRLVAWTGGYAPALMTPDERNFAPGAEDAIVRFLDPHLQRLEQARLQLALESYITLACPDAPSLRRLLDRLPPTVGAVLDPPNLTPLARFPERDHVLGEMFRVLCGRITVVHMKDFKLAKDGRSYELPGALLGEMNYHLFADEIRALPEPVPLIAEHIAPAAFAETRRKLLPIFEGGKV
jgi:sugar phosphate isomerase/epimerase